MASRALSPLKTRRHSITAPLPKAGHRYWLFLLTILGGYVILQTILIPGLPLTYNEGISLQISQLINRGYEPYIQIFTLAGPLFVWLMGWLGRFSLSPTGFRLFFLVFGLLLLINTSLIARALLGEGAALATTLLLATTITFLAEAATTIIAVTPAVSLATLSLVFTLHYLATRQLPWIFFGGIGWGMALFLSTSVLSIALVTLILIIFFETGFSLTPNWRNSYQPMAIWLVGTLIILGIGLFLTTPTIIFGHILADYATLRQNLPVALVDNSILFGQFITFNLWLFLVTVYTLVRVYDDAHHPLWLIFIWGVLSFAWLMLQVGLRLIDLAILLPPLAIMAGWGLVDLGKRLIHWSYSRPINHSKQYLLWATTSLFFLTLYLGTNWLQINDFNLRAIDNPDDLIQLERRPEIVDFIHRHTTPNDCVIIDDAALAIAAGRLPAPPLVELSKERIASGLITEETMETVAQEYKCKAVIFSKRKYTQPLASFRSWAGTYYPNQQKFTRIIIYYQ
jgi:hypothetical protein